MRLIAMLALALSSTAAAQTTRTALPEGQITGLEMAIEGPREVRPGESPRWLIAAHEIHRDRDYRPADGISVRMFASIQPDQPVAEATTDEHGRAILGMDVPEDVPGFELLIDARSPQRQIRRRFRVYVYARDDRSLSTRVLLDDLQAGASNAVMGEVRNARGPTEVEVVARASEGGRVLFGPERVRTAPDGSYALPFTLPRSFTGSAQVDAKLVGTETNARAELRVNPPPTRSMQVRAAPARRVARAGETVPVTVYVRDAAGRPLQGAVVRGLPALPDHERAPRAQTDARGRATLPWYIRPSDQRVEDRRAQLRVVAPGIGEREASVSIRVTRAAIHAQAIAEGGALIPGVPSRVFVRVLDAEGAPAAGRELTITADRLGQHEESTDEEGVAVFEVTLREEGNAAPDACGGATALALDARVADSSQTICVPVDPDGTVRVRARTGQEGIHVELLPREVVRSAPILVTLVRREADRLLPIDQRVLPAGRTQTTWPLASDAHALLVRARPLIGAGLHEIRGGMAPVITPRPESELAWTGPATLRAPTATIVAALPLAWAHSVVEGVGHAPGTDAHWHAQLAMRTPRDDSAPAIWRDGRIRTLPAPDDPVSFGVLRDPWRQRARYRTGRLALVIRTLEEYVEQAPHVDVVAFRERGRWTFNRALLDAIADNPAIGPEGARDLGGLPLDIDALEALDASLTFDRMARRITRERLLRAFVSMREQVRQRNLDLPFGRRGTPADWIAAFAVDHDEALFRDAWGNALRLVRSARASDFDLVPGWRLASAGPDGRFGNADDVVDFTARVLPSGSLYADAMDEDGLLARLNGVALGRATLAEIAQLFDAAGARTIIDDGATGPWDTLPSRLPPAIDPARLLARGTDVRVFGSHSGRVEPNLPPDPADYGLVALAWHEGRPIARVQRHRHGHGVMLAADWPERLGRNGWMLAPQVIAFDEVRNARLVVTTRGARVSPQNTAIDLDAGEAASLPIQLEGGNGRTAVVTLKIESGGETLWSHRLQLPVHGAAVDRTRWAGAWVGDAWDIGFELPRDAERAHGELVVVAHDRLFEDPLVRRWESSALRGWGAALVGRVPDAELRASLDVRGGLPDALEGACALLAWTALSDEEGVEWLAGYRRALGRVTRAELDGTRENASTLAALAPVAGGAPVVAEHDALQRRIDAIRESLWDGMRTHAEQPELMARAAAALLLADPTDASGRALFVAAKRHVVDHERGGRWLPGTSVEDGLGATAALAIAANVLGDDPLRDDARRALGTRAWLGLLREGDAGFWLIAASSYGALGSGSARAFVDGERIELEGGVARHRFDSDGNVELSLSGRGLGLARVRVRYERPIGESQDGPLELALEGDLGDARSTSALEISVVADDDANDPEILVQLPPGALLDRASRRRMSALDVVRSVEAPDREGVVRIRLTPLAAGARTRIPLPVRWSGAGETRGFALVGFDASQPWATFSIPSRNLTLD